MTTEKPKKLCIICENCDSEYQIKFDKLTVSGNPVFCAFCGEEIEDATDDEADEELDAYPTDDDE